MTDQRRRVHDMFRQQGFLPADNASYPVLKNYVQYSGLQEMSPVMIVVWFYIYHGLYKIIDGCLCCVFFYEERPVYFTVHRPRENPGRPLQKIIDVLYDLSRKAGLPFLQIKFVEERFLNDYRAVAGYRIQTEYRDDNSEYAYRIKDLTELPGPDNYYKRKRLKKFVNNGKFSLRPVTQETMHLCVQIEEEWCRRQDCAYCASFTGCEKKAMEAMVDIFDGRLHTGLFLYDEETPVGYIICEKINERLSFLYFGKANVQDGFVYLIYMMYKEYLSGAEYMNISEDMGHPGLRQFKAHLSRHEFWRKYIVTFTGAEEEA
jgi:hypothetical protein